jgi:hypothetical protein
LYVAPNISLVKYKQQRLFQIWRRKRLHRYTTLPPGENKQWQSQKPKSLPSPVHSSGELVSGSWEGRFDVSQSHPDLPRKKVGRSSGNLNRIVGSLPDKKCDPAMSRRQGGYSRKIQLRLKLCQYVFGFPVPSDTSNITQYVDNIENDCLFPAKLKKPKFGCNAVA